MRPTRSALSRSIALAAIVVPALFSLSACADSPTEPRAAAARVASEPALVRVGDAFDYAVTHPCQGSALSTLANNKTIGLGATLVAGGVSELQKGGGGSGECGCPQTTTPPSRLPGWTCTLKSSECVPGSGVTTCTYTCTAPTRTAGW